MAETLLRKAWHRVQRAHITRYLQRHPTAGIRQENGSYCYQRGLLTAHYQYQPERQPADQIGGLRIRRLLSSRERFARALLGRCRALCSVEGVLTLCRWPVGGVVVVTLLLCALLTESEASRCDRLAWLVGSLLRVSPSHVHIAPNGWVTVQTQRRTAGDHVMEPVTLVAHPGRWLLGDDDVGSVTRDRGKSYGVVTHPLQVNDHGDIWLYKDRQWHGGRREGTQIIWDHPEGTGVRTGLVQQQTLPKIEDSSHPPEQ